MKILTNKQLYQEQLDRTGTVLKPGHIRVFKRFVNDNSSPFFSKKFQLSDQFFASEKQIAQLTLKSNVEFHILPTLISFSFLTMEQNFQ